MGRSAAPTLPRILLIAALCGWIAFAVTEGFSTEIVWAGVGAALAVLSVVELLGRRRTASGAATTRPTTTQARSTRAEVPLKPLVAPPPLTPPGLPESGLLGPFSPLPPPRALLPKVTTRIDLPSSEEGKNFARLTPFGDARTVLVRRGEAMGHHYGLEQGRRLVAIAGHEFLLVSFMQQLSPPVLRPGESPMSAEAARSYRPEYDVLYLPDAEVLIPREPRGFSDAEVERILAAISISPLSPSASDSATPASPASAMACLHARSASSFELKKAITVVGASAPPGAVPLLRTFLRNTDLTVVEEACNALARLEARDAIADLLDLLRPEAAAERNLECAGDPFGWPESPPRASALHALTRLRALEAEPAVRPLLTDADSEVQRLARRYFTVLGLKI